ncbi:MAG: hypothetical protein ACNA8L_08515 [Luteolibacter sp.]|jgi:hypothetical protein
MKPDRSQWTIKVFNSFEEAESSEKMERAALTGEERLRITENLRAIHYGYAESGIEPRLERTLKLLPHP